MSDPQTRRDEAKGPEAGLARRIGRRAATAFLWLVVVYLVGIGFISVVPQVFFPERAALAQEVRCLDEVARLRGQLMARASRQFTTSGATIEAPSNEEIDSFRQWLAHWDRVHRGLEARCTESDERRAWELVGRLRQRVATTLRRVDAEEGALLRELDPILTEGAGAGPLGML